MVRAVNRLSAVRVRGLKKPGRYADGDGLYFYITKLGSRSWVFRYRERGSSRLRDMGLGPERDISLENARDKARAARESLREGTDPLALKHSRKSDQAAELAKRLTFGQCVERYISAHKDGWRNEKHRAQWESTLNTYATKLLNLPVADIDTGLVVEALEPVWKKKTETATRVRQRIEAVLDWAAVRQYRSGENPARWRGHLDKLLPKPTRLKKVTHRAALPYDEIPTFIAELRATHGLSARALELQVLTAMRPGEIAGASWSEFDLKNALWTIPGERMKAGRPHRVPLSAPALAILKALPQLDKFVFPGRTSSRSMTTAAPMKTLKGLRPGLTAHGFRSSFRDWAADTTAYPREVAEEALAHALKDKTEAAYRRSDMFVKRTRLMIDWATYCAKIPTSKAVASIGDARRKKKAAGK